MIVFQVATDFWDSILRILNLDFWNFLATVIKKLLYCFFLCVFVNAQILLKEVDPENLFRSGESTESKKASEKPRKMRGFGGDGKREEVTGLALSADGMKIYWSLAVKSLLFQRHMCHVDIM